MLKRETRQVLLAITAALNALLLLVFLDNRHVARDPRPPEGARELAAWLAEHPGDWKAAASLTSIALDSTLPRRFELWRASHELGRTLAPRRTHAAAGFVRAGLFHWYELNDADRAAVLAAAAPLMRGDVRLFDQLHRPLYQLTRDLEYLRRAAPPTVDALLRLRDLAAAYGRFDDYRALREEVRRRRLAIFQQRRATASIAELIAFLPPELRTADVPLVRGVLEELDRRPFDPAQLNSRVEVLATFALDHGLTPLGGLTPLIAGGGDLLRDATRVRLALAVGDRAAATRVTLSSHAPPAVPMADDVWDGMCAPRELCAVARVNHRGTMTLTLDVAQTDEIPPYVEIYVDDALAAEGEVREPRTFTVGSPGAHHRIEVRVVNPVTRAGIQRRVRLV
ncbi:MAG TPA: hypothetical protein VHK90_08885 [Thermoanaerobaculia bacterium]|nr:hypothetical protein [Thermoanaerobaculia bacterium]